MYSTITVSTYFNSSSIGWNINLLRDTFKATTIFAILELKVYPTTSADKILCLLATNGQFQVKTPFRLLESPTGQTNSILTSAEWKLFWKLKIHNRLKILLWKLIWNALPTTVCILSKISSPLNPPTCEPCSLCNTENEDVSHLVQHCDFVKKLCRLSPWPIQLESLQSIRIKGWILSILNPSNLLNISDTECLLKPNLTTQIQIFIGKLYHTQTNQNKEERNFISQP